MSYIPISIVLLCFGWEVTRASPLSPEGIDKILNAKGIFLNNKLTTLGELYGKVPSTLKQFNLGREIQDAIASQQIINLNSTSCQNFEELRCAGGIYMKRKFTTWSSQSILSESELSSIIDTPTALARKILTNINSRVRTPLIAIVGNVGMGKSVAMTKIEYEISRSMTSVLTIHVDLEDMRITEKLSTINLSKLIEYSVENHHELFLNLLKINPKNLIILFDGIDHCFRDDIRNIFSMINDVLNKGTTVVVSGSLQSVSRLAHLAPVVYQIPELSISETEIYLKNCWSAFFKGIETQMSIANNQRFQDYVIAFTQILYQTPIPRSSRIIRDLATAFEDESASSILQTNPSNEYGAGVLNYVLNKSFPVLKLLAALENVRLNKMLLYEVLLADYLEVPYMTNTTTMEFYGPLALNQIAGDALLQNKRLEADLKLSQQLLSQYGKEQFRFIKTNGESLEFVHSEYQLYYAAKYILSRITDANFPQNMIRTLLSDSAFNQLAEFIYSGMECSDQLNKMAMNLLRIIIMNKQINERMLDNLLRLGFDRLSYKILRALCENKIFSSQLKIYFLQLGTYDLSAERRLGMLPIERTSEPNNELFQLSSPGKRRRVTLRTEFLFHNEMIHCIGYFSKIHRSVTYLNEHSLFNSLLNVAIRPQPNLRLFTTLINWPIEVGISKSSLNHLLYETIIRVGAGCQSIANKLIEVGAVSADAKFKGRTLLHAAVQSRNKELLRYVIEDLGLPAENTIDELNGRSVLDAALDANPFPAYSAPGWWDMMSYMVEKFPNLGSSIKPIVNSERYKITQSDVESSWFAALTGPNVVAKFDFHTQTLTLRPMSMSANHERMSSLTRLIRPVDTDLSFGALAARRKFLFDRLFENTSSTAGSNQMMNVIFLSDILVYYRGVDSLSSEQHEQYRLSIDHALKRESGLNNGGRSRILQRIVANIDSDADSQDYFQYIWEHNWKNYINTIL